jgi:hypothetical protein
VTRRIPLSLPGLVGLSLWGLAVALVVAAASVGPEGQCDYDNHDSYVAAARRAGLALDGAALAMGAAASLLAAGALGRRRRRSQVIRGLGALLAFGLAGVTGFVAVLELVAFGCLE